MHRSAALALVICIALLAVASADNITAAPRRLIRSGYFGIHACTLPACSDYSQLVQGTQGYAPYAYGVQADVVRNQIYWIPVDLTSQPQFGVAAAMLDTGKPAHGSQYIWVPSSNQLGMSAFEPISGMYYYTNSSNALFALNPDTAVSTFVVQFKTQNLYRASFFRNRVLYFSSSNPCVFPKVCPCIYQYALDSQATSETALVCGPTVPLPQQPAVLAGSADHIIVADPNDDHALILDYAGNKISVLSLNTLTPAGSYFWSDFAVDQQSNTLLVCASLRSQVLLIVCPSLHSLDCCSHCHRSLQSYSVALGAIDLNSGNGTIIMPSVDFDSCMGMFVVGNPPAANLPMINQIAPVAGPQRSAQGATIFVAGANFQNSAMLACRFGGAVGTAAIFHMNSVIECVLPSSPVAGRARVQVTNDGMTFSSDMVFYTFQPPTTTAN
jgi:hypothetical protein